MGGEGTQGTQDSDEEDEESEAQVEDDEEGAVLTLFDVFAKHYHDKEFIRGLHKRGWVDWGRTGVFELTGEDHERWGYECRPSDDADKAASSAAWPAPSGR